MDSKIAWREREYDILYENNMIYMIVIGILSNVVPGISDDLKATVDLKEGTALIDPSSFCLYSSVVQSTKGCKFLIDNKLLIT